MKLSNRSYKRSMKLAVGVAVSALALSGCSITGGSSDAGSSGDGTGTVNALFMKQAGYSEDDIGKMITDFTSQNPDIDVNPTFVSYEALHDKIVTAAPSGTYDAFLSDVIWTAEFASKGIASDITDRIPQNWDEDMLAGALATGEYEGKYYGAPAYPSSKFFYYNKEMVKKVGATEEDLQTWDGVLKVAKKIKKQEGIDSPLSWSWSQAEALIADYAQLLGAFGGEFTDENGKLVINDEHGVDTLNWMIDSMNAGLTNDASTTFLENEVTKSMAQGQTAFALNWDSTLVDLDDPEISKVVGKIGVMQTPAGPSGERPGVNGSMSMSIASKSQNKDAAWKLLEFMSSKENQDQYAKSAMPNWKASYEDPEVTKSNPEEFEAARNAFDSLIARPEVTDYNSVSQVIQVEIQRALLGQKTAQEALDDAVATANKGD